MRTGKEEKLFSAASDSQQPNWVPVCRPADINCTSNARMSVRQFVRGRIKLFDVHEPLNLWHEVEDHLYELNVFTLHSGWSHPFILGTLWPDVAAPVDHERRLLRHGD